MIVGIGSPVTSCIRSYTLPLQVGPTSHLRGLDAMNRMQCILTVSIAMVSLATPLAAAAQDVAITNARIIVGTGQVIDSGTIIVRGGKIVTAGAGPAPTQGL